MINRGGLTIQTAIDPKTQDLAQKKVSSVVGPKDPLISTMNMIQPGTGLIIAMAQSRPVMGSDAKKGQTYWNLAADPAMGGIQGYQAGSTFKAFTLGRALEKGIPISKKFNAQVADELHAAGGSSPVHGREPRLGALGRQELRRATARRSACTEAAAVVGEHLLHPARAGHRHVPGHQDGREGRRQARARTAAAVDIVDYYQDKPSFTLGIGRGQPAVDGRGVRDLRGPRHPLRPDHRLQDHHPDRQEPRRRRTPTAGG